MAENKTTLAAIVKYLRDVSHTDRTLSSDAREGVEIAAEVLERAYNITDNDVARAGPLHVGNTGGPSVHKTSPQEAKERAVSLKESGNELMRMEEYAAALEKYSQAIELDAQNAVYFCNRAAAFTKLNNQLCAIDDCKTALSLDSSYAKAHARMGTAYIYLEKYKEARDCYKKAYELEHDNLTYYDNLRMCEERLESSGQASDSPNLPNLSEIFTEHNVLNFATQLLSDPSVQQGVTQLAELIPELLNSVLGLTNQNAADSNGQSTEHSSNAN